MKKILLRFSLVVLSLFIFIALIFAVTASENNKKSKAYAKTKDHYTTLYNDWLRYKEEYQAETEKIKAENKLEIEKAKKQYEDLLAKQPELIKQNTKLVISNSAGTAQTQTKSVTVKKPQSKPVTKSS